MVSQKPLLIVVGRAASGKDTFVGRIKNDKRTMALSHTTRPKRNGEGDTHIFIDDIKGHNDRILETIINGYHYFLTREDLKTHDILIVDTRGVHDIIALKNFHRPFQIIYINIDRKTRQKRYMNRSGVSFTDFTKRDFSEDVQFMRFEEFISLPENKEKYDIKVLSNDKEINQEVKRLNGRE